MRSRFRPPLTLTEPGETAKSDAASLDLPSADQLDIPPVAPTPQTSQTELAQTTREPSVEPQTDLTPRQAAAAAPHVTPSLSRSERPSTPRHEASSLVYWGGAAFAALLWALGLGAFALGAEGGLGAFQLTPFRITVFALMTLFPAGLLLACAYALRQAARLSEEARRTREIADIMVAPMGLAMHQTNKLVEVMRDEIDAAVRVARGAYADMTQLREAMQTETERLNAASETAHRTTRLVTEALKHEREAMANMGHLLDAQASGVMDAVDRQARMVADASDLAQAQLREAEAALAARAADLAAAAGETHDTSKLVAEDLARQTLRLETTGASVADPIRSGEVSLSQQRAGLVSAALSLRADQEDFAAHLENQRAQLAEALDVTRNATVELGEVSSRGVDVLRDLVQSALDQFQSVSQAAETERAGFETRIHSTLSNISVMASDARDELVEETQRALAHLTNAAEEARRAADMAAQAAQARVDRLNETVF
ncbi:MAG: tipN, partial [Asticcacaulis sp.]